ncbi:hypothetical protein JJB09_00010 [Rhizobium sp. KVB221]|uniref:Uncharacterized protein n=1 Tax=Rhizobium setariae TaxID=2801340 RepID=A0A936YLK2_9HYPH|nr:hypothetical protein [Rhizobium setariae]MBL0370399.1 hypothetical protein [Rhizobium setariae]
MAHVKQADLVKEIAGLVQQYRDGDPALVKFGMKCGITLDRHPVGAGIMHSPKLKQETFQIKDSAFRQNFQSDKDAFFAAFDRFVANGQFLAWSGKVPKEGQAAILKTLNEDHTRPTMQIEMICRKRGSESEQKLQMLFIGFGDDKEAAAYADQHAIYVM